MKAVILVGGEGTRMRPLTQTIPKPLLPLVNRPFLSEVLDRLAEHGVDEVVLSSPNLESTFRPFIDSRDGSAPRITWITETDPLDTAGAIVAALGLLGEEAFFVLNPAPAYLSIAAFDLMSGSAADLARVLRRWSRLAGALDGPTVSLGLGPSLFDRDDLWTPLR